MSIISIIIPIYNVEEYIYRCVDSITNQTYNNLEIILVDDGSPDASGKICDEYAEKDRRIKVIHKKNGGLSEARNFGIDAATGEWLFFLDSDDWLHPQTIEKLYYAAVSSGTKISVCGYVETNGENPQPDNSVEFKIWTPKALYIEQCVTATIACGKLYHRSCFETIRYPVGKIHEDEFVTYRILFAQDKIAFINQPYYTYYVNPDGITKSQWNPKRLDAMEALDEQMKFFESLGDAELIEHRERLYFLHFVSHEVNARKFSYMKSVRQLRRKALFIILKKPRKFFSAKYIWIPEHFFPKFMRYYWLAKAVRRKLFEK